MPIYTAKYRLEQDTSMWGVFANSTSYIELTLRAVDENDALELAKDLNWASGRSGIARDDLNFESVSPKLNLESRFG